MPLKSFCFYNGLNVEYIKNDQVYNMPQQHYHDSYELYLQLDGKRYLFLDDESYDLVCGDMVFLSPYEIHHMASLDSHFYERYVMNFDKSLLMQILTESELNMLLTPLKSCVVHLDEVLFEKAKVYFSDLNNSVGGGFLASKTAAFSITNLLLILRSFSELAGPAKSKKIDSSVIDTIHYINNNFDKEICLSDLADMAHMSKFHFCRLFHSTTGATLGEYLRNVRLAKVHKMLVNTDLPLSQIAQRTGFDSTSKLTYSFRKIYGISPRAFRKNSKNK